MKPERELPFALPQASKADVARAARLSQALEKAYPDAKCELDYQKPHELLVATILSAQTTDAGVNRATPALFKRFPTPAAYAAASPADIEPYVRSLGFFRAKARAVHEAMREITDRFGGEVPQRMEDLLTLRGVARKTASVVLGNAFRINEGIPVDTHVQRLAVRLCLVEPGSTVAAIERRLMALFPRSEWCMISHRLIWHGRRACKARLPACAPNAICQEFGLCCDLRDQPRKGKKAPASSSARPRKPAPKAPPKPGRKTPLKRPKA